MRRSLNVEAHGALVNSLTPGGAAEKAGLQRGDIITAINGAAVRDSNSLRNEVGQMLPGAEVKVTRAARREGADVDRPARREAAADAAEAEARRAPRRRLRARASGSRSSR